tara:strand:- start:255 stop:494 length:240 start_codon:yes stop_codon:yes gene_type:complete
MGSKQMAFRFDEDLIELVKQKAKAQRRSLNNYIEVLMVKDVGNIPNKETRKAIAEAMEGENLEEIKDVDSFMDSILMSK